MPTESWVRLWARVITKTIPPSSTPCMNEGLIQDKDFSIALGSVDEEHGKSWSPPGPRRTPDLPRPVGRVSTAGAKTT